MNQKRLKLSLAALQARVPVNWRPDPHKRGGSMASKKLYQRKPRTPLRGFYFVPAAA